MTFDSLVKECIEVLVEACAYADGDCSKCPKELRDFCSCDKPINYNN